ncbi:hypothetical protein C4565_00965 [Candidatus Parcubacteria bacterium]|jgi:hypothetical protein|nr:MAG: hypothetical protein C4565_00965 [Candidatus Parcubacteria bacterium]
MKNKKKLNMRHNLFLLTFVCLFFGFFLSTNAANPELIVTWKADNFFPTSYIGKAVPSYGTKVYLAVEAVQNGTLLDVSNSTIEWRKNGERIRKGTGEKEAMVVFSETDRTNFVSVSVDWNGVLIQKSITIPTTEPKLILEIPYINNVVPKNSDISITAVPYFFNTKSFEDLSFSWQIGLLKKGTGSNNKITINTGNPSTTSNNSVSITGYVQNKKSLLEIIKTQTKIFIGN